VSAVVAVVAAAVEAELVVVGAVAASSGADATETAAVEAARSR